MTVKVPDSTFSHNNSDITFSLFIHGLTLSEEKFDFQNSNEKKTLLVILNKFKPFSLERELAALKIW